MSLQTSFDEIWNGKAPAKEPFLCPLAASFAAWANELVDRILGEPDVVAINQAKVLLVDRFFEYRNYAPKKHRVISNSGGGHICIFQVFEEHYERLKAVELALTPPLLFLPEPPRELVTAEPPVQIAGIFLGEVE